MKLKYIRFTDVRGDQMAYPRGHLRWMELGETDLRFGFSSESVIVNGHNLELLMQEIVTGKMEHIRATAARHATSDTWTVDRIAMQPYAEQSPRENAALA